MAEKKAGDVEGWLRKPDPKVAVVLVYGPDRGLVSERARRFAEATGLPLDDAFSVVRLEAAEMEREEGRLIDEAGTVPMFSPRRLIWIRNAGAQKRLADQVRLLSANPPRDAVILIEAGELKKTAPLRTAVEAGAAGMALPCFGDEGGDLDRLIHAELGKTGMRISPEARELLQRNLGGDRIASRGELAKLALYAHGRAEIGVEDVAAMTGDVSGTTVDDAVDCLIEGRISDFDAAFARNSMTASQAFQMLSGAMRRMQALDVMRGAMQGGRSASAAVASARPPLYGPRRDAAERALGRWSHEALTRALTRLQATVLATRRRPELAVAITRQALLAIAVESARSGRNR